MVKCLILNRSDQTTEHAQCKISFHFEDSYRPMFPKSKGLKPTAVPSLFMNSSSISVNDSNTTTLSSPVFSNSISTPTKIVHNPSTSSFNTIYSPADEYESLSFCTPSTRKKLNFYPRYVGDCTEDHFSTPNRKKKNLIFVKN
ncbi:THAP-type domain-containing protein, partial [Aphis craccivora]